MIYREMKSSKYVRIVCIVACLALLAMVGCQNKKKVTPKQEAQTEEPAPVVEEPQPVTPEPETPEVKPEPVIEPIVELVEEAVEEKADEPQKPEEWRPQYQTAYGKGTLTIFYKQQRLPLEYDNFVVSEELSLLNIISGSVRSCKVADDEEGAYK